MSDGSSDLEAQQSRHLVGKAMYAVAIVIFSQLSDAAAQARHAAVNDR